MGSYKDGRWQHDTHDKLQESLYGVFGFFNERSVWMNIDPIMLPAGN